MSEIEKRTIDYIKSVANGEYKNEPNWALLAIITGIFDIKKESV